MIFLAGDAVARIDGRQAGDRFDLLRCTYPFLANASPPRSPFGPTPVFLGRPAYRAAYEAILQAKAPLGILVDGDALRISYQRLATLYEYWCFMQVVSLLRDRLGPPRPRTAFELIDGIYRPEQPNRQGSMQVGPFRPRLDFTVTGWWGVGVAVLAANLGLHPAELDGGRWGFHPKVHNRCRKNRLVLVAHPISRHASQGQQVAVCHRLPHAPRHAPFSGHPSAL